MTISHLLTIYQIYYFYKKDRPVFSFVRVEKISLSFLWGRVYQQLKIIVKCFFLFFYAKIDFY